MRVIGILCLYVLVLFGCSEHYGEREWYLKGGDIHLVLDWDEHQILMESHSELIFRGVILSREEKEGMIQLHTRLDKVNERYAQRYPADFRKDFILWLKFPKEDLLKLTMSQLSSETYTFISHPTVEVFVPYKQGRFLSGEEIQSFLKEESGNNIENRFAISIIPDATPLWTSEEVSKKEKTSYRKWMRDKYRVPASLPFYQMTDYLQDVDPSTAFITKDPVETLSLEYHINRRGEDIAVPLQNAIPIRAIDIVTGNLDNPSDFSQYRLPKSLTIYFTTQSKGGLGNTKGNYNERALKVFLTREKIPHFIYLYKPILAKSISVYVDSYYEGEGDEMAIFDLAFFTSNF